MFCYPNVPAGHLVCSTTIVVRERSGRNVSWMRCEDSVFTAADVVFAHRLDLLRYKTFLTERYIALRVGYKPGVPMGRGFLHAVPSSSCPIGVPMGCGFMHAGAVIIVFHRDISSVAQQSEPYTDVLCTTCVVLCVWCGIASGTRLITVKKWSFNTWCKIWGITCSGS